jgi:membrane-associated HD superfamily phosphohydrolase
MKKEWLKEQARDLIALGSIAFLVLTVVRVSVITPYYPMQFIIGSVLFFILKMIFKAELHAGIGFILLTFTSLFYRNVLFTIFALIVYAGIIISLLYLKRDKELILKGIFLGMVSAGIGYIVVRWIFF